MWPSIPKYLLSLKGEKKGNLRLKACCSNRELGSQKNKKPNLTKILKTELGPL